MGKPFIVAEIGASHNGHLKMAMELITASARAGADFVKLQTFHPDRMVLDTGYIIKNGPWAGKNLHKLYAQTMTPWEWHKELFEYAKMEKIGIFSSPFSPEDVALLETINCKRYKISSFDIVDEELIEACALTGRPMVISTGMASRGEIENAVVKSKYYGCTDITILSCVSDYPAKAQQYDLRTICDIAYAYGVKWGVSDHTIDNTLAVAATAMGAEMIERHITLGFGEDAGFATRPLDFAKFVQDVRITTDLLYLRKGMRAEVHDHHELIKSLYFTMDLKEGDEVAPYHVRACRPSLGLTPFSFREIVGKRLIKPAKRGEPVAWKHFHDREN